MAKIQRCIICDCPTSRCEDDSIFLLDIVGPLCDECANYIEKIIDKKDGKE